MVKSTGGLFRRVTLCSAAPSPNLEYPEYFFFQFELNFWDVQRGSLAHLRVPQTQTVYHYSAVSSDYLSQAQAEALSIASAATTAMSDEHAASPLVAGNGFADDNGRPDCPVGMDHGIDILPARERGRNKISSPRENATPGVNASLSTNSACHERPARVITAQSTANSRAHGRVIRPRSLTANTARARQRFTSQPANCSYCRQRRRAESSVWVCGAVDAEGRTCKMWVRGWCVYNYKLRNGYKCCHCVPREACSCSCSR